MDDMVAMPMDTWKAIWAVVEASAKFLETAETNAVEVQAGRDVDADAMRTGYQTLRACIDRLETLDHPGH